MALLSDKTKEIIALFFRLGITAFGGPAAHIAMMQQEVVDKRRWMTEQEFLDMISATQLIPGPNSTEMAIHCGAHRNGWKGLIAAGIAFIFPAMTITGIIGWLYFTYGQLPNIQPYMEGIKPAVISLILFAVWNLGKKVITTPLKWTLGFVTIGFAIIGFNEILSLLSVGVLAIILKLIANTKGKLASIIIPLPLLLEPISFSSWQIFTTFLKIGATLYGSGYVLFAFLKGELVDPGILTQAQLIDAVAVGQITPGPVLSTATFIGWQLGNIQGAALATLGIFLPSFILVAILHPIIPKLRKSKIFSAFLDGVNAAAIALILVVIWDMGKATLINWQTISIATTSFIVMLLSKGKVNSLWIVIGGALSGYLLSLL